MFLTPSRIMVIKEMSMHHASVHETSRRRDPNRATPLMALFAITLAVAVYPVLFWVGYGRWWDDPPGEAWAVFVVTAIIGASLVLVLVSATIGAVTSATETRVVRSFGRLLGSVAVFSVGLPLAVIAGVAAGLSGFSCSGGVIGEGCSGGSPWFGFLIGGLVLGCTAWIAWAVGRPKD